MTFEREAEPMNYVAIVVIVPIAIPIAIAKEPMLEN